MNFSESRQNRSRENREKSKNRFFFPTPINSPVVQAYSMYSVLPCASMAAAAISALEQT